VIDGDTLTIDRDGVPTTLRLIGLDTPESSTTRTGSVECFGHEATEYARALLSSTSFAIETDNTQDTYDRYGRLLVYAYLPDGTLINKKMIEDGFGHEYTYRVPYRYQSEFKAAEAAAREERRGLWAPGTCPTSAAPQKQSAAAAVPSSGTYECSKNVYNCSSFSSQSEAQTAFDACGGSSNDVHKLDGNGDGEVCESLP
jgi:micrococcal nuclease